MTQEIILTNFGNLKAYPFKMTKTTNSFEAKDFFGNIEQFTNTEIYFERVDAVNLTNSQTLKKEKLSEENIFAIYNENNVGLYISNIDINNFINKNRFFRLKMCYIKTANLYKFFCTFVVEKMGQKSAFLMNIKSTKAFTD